MTDSLAFVRPSLRNDMQRNSQSLHDTLSRVADEIEDRGADRYAPPAVRSASSAARWAGEVNMDELAQEIALNPIRDVGQRLLALTYGEMMEVCEAITVASDYKAPGTAQEFAAVLYRWAKG
jgi:hypothetical protein